MQTLFSVLGYTPGGDLLTPRRSMAAEASQMGIITTLAKIQSGIYINHLSAGTADSQVLLDRYTQLICKASTEQISSTDLKTQPNLLESSIVGGLVPSWIAVLGSLEWNIFSDDAIVAMSELYHKLGQVIFTPFS